MTFKQFGVLAGFALAADAFMIPSTMSMPEAKGDGIEALKALDPSRLADTQYPGQITKLSCPNCKLPGGFDIDMSLILNWTVADEGKTLLLNNAPFIGSNDVEPLATYDFLQLPSPLPDFVTEFMSSHGQVNYQTSPDSDSHVLEPLSLHVATSIRQISATDDTDAQLIDVDFHINDAQAGKPAQMDGMSLRIIKDEQNTLNILDIVRIPADGSAADEDKSQDGEEEQMFEILPISPIRPADSDEVPQDIPVLRHKPQIINCHGLPLSICRIQHMIKMRILSMHRAMAAAISGRPTPAQHRPCQKARPNGPPGLNIKGGVNKFTNPDGTPKVPPPGFHHNQHAMFRACRMLRRFFFGFVIPVLIGVAAGMTASLAGMLVGTALAMLWFKIRRGGKRGQQGNVRLEQGEDCESEALMKEAEAEVEAAPWYSEEALPAYEEKQSQTDL